MAEKRFSLARVASKPNSYHSGAVCSDSLTNHVSVVYPSHMPHLKNDAEINRSYGFASLSPAIEKCYGGSKVTVLGRAPEAETSMGSHKVRVRDEEGREFITDAWNIAD